MELGCKILDYMWERGWDKEHGGILYFRDVYDKPVQEYWQDMKFWWPHNEVIIATLLAHTMTAMRNMQLGTKWYMIMRTANSMMQQTENGLGTYIVTVVLRKQQKETCSKDRFICQDRNGIVCSF